MNVNKKRNILLFCLSTVISLGIGIISIRAWEIDFTAIPSMSGDANLGLMIIKSIIENGFRGLFFCTGLAAPDISALIDTPFLDMNFAGIAWILSKFTSCANVIYYVMYLLTFPLAAMAMYFLLHHLRVKDDLKFLFSICFAVTPYHFMRSYNHMTLSYYWVIPIAIYLSVVIYEEEFAGIVPQRYKGCKGKTALLFLCCIILGLSNIYYAFFGLICMAVSCLAKYINQNKLRVLKQEAVLIYFLLDAVLAGLLPKLVYSAVNGANLEAGVRTELESELYGLKLIQLLLPCPYNRISLLRNWNAIYSANAINVNENAMASLGIVAEVGFVIACVWVILKLARKAPIEKEGYDRINLLSFEILVLLLFCTVGGIGTIVAYFITPEIRALNRVSIFIVGLSVAVLAEYLTRVQKTEHKKSVKRLVTALTVALCLFSFYSEIDVKASGWRDATEEEDAILRVFFSEVEDALDEGDMVYELPYMDFPESPAIYGMADYEPGLGYLYTSSIRWSYGGLRGRNTSAKSLNIDGGQSDRFVNELLLAGFSGVYIDTKGFDDGGEAVLSFYSDYLGLTPIVSEDQWLYFYKLDGVEPDQRKLGSGYNFFEDFSNEYAIGASADEISMLAEQVTAYDDAATEIVWSWLQNVDELSDVTDAEYLRWLYVELLSREPSEDEVNGWLTVIQTSSREEILGRFLQSAEFHNKEVA